jgi:hypothetical protein
MSQDLFLLLVGAGIGLVSSLVGIFVQHSLSLRAERKKRDWEREDREAEERRKQLLLGTDGAISPEAARAAQQIMRARAGSIISDVRQVVVGGQMEAGEQEEPEEPSE